MCANDCRSSSGLSVLLLVRLEIDHGVDLLRAVAQQALKVAHEAVHVPLARGLKDDVLVVVIPAMEGIRR